VFAGNLPNNTAYEFTCIRYQLSADFLFVIVLFSLILDDVQIII